LGVFAECRHAWLQGSLVRQLKKDGADGWQVTAEVAKLQQLRAQLEEAKKAQEGAEDTAAFNRPGAWATDIGAHVLRERMAVPTRGT
jgi:hypothetical protein